MQTKRFNIITSYLAAPNETSVRYFTFTICYVPSMLERKMLVMFLPEEIGNEVCIFVNNFICRNSFVVHLCNPSGPFGESGREHCY